MNAIAAASRSKNDRGPVVASHESFDSEAAKNPTIIIVEDDFVIANDLEHDLVAAGYKVVGIASTTDEAIALSARERPTLAIMDVRLANNSDGVEAALKLYRDLNIRSVFATAHIDPATQERAQAARPLGWLAKPYSSQSLIEFLKKTFSN